MSSKKEEKGEEKANPHRLTSLLPQNISGGLQPPRNRSYRRREAETPSDPGGVNREAYYRQRQKSSHWRHRSDDQHEGDDRGYSSSGRRREFDRDDRRRERDNEYGRDDRQRQGDRKRYRGDDQSRDNRQQRPQSNMPPPPRRRQFNSTHNITPSTASTRSLDRPRTVDRDRRMLDAPTPTQGRPSLKDPPRNLDLDPDTALLDDEGFDRDFYLAEDEGHFVRDGNNDMGRFLFENTKTKEREEQIRKPTARESRLKDDQEAWEQNRLLSSGVLLAGERDLNVDTQADTRVTLLVHQVKPPFLDGRVSFSTIREAVPTVRDASSDFAKAAREGSETLRVLRAKKDKNTMRNKFWELGGSRMGNAMGVKDDTPKETGDTADTTANGEIDYKKTSGFASHMKNDEKSKAVSDFAKQKSIREQREFLPVYSVRQELLNVIRENNVVIIVGETGSGTRENQN